VLRIVLSQRNNTKNVIVKKGKRAKEDAKYNSPIVEGVGRVFS